MMRPLYTLTLARTKLRSKRGILATSVIAASLLFSVLVAAVIIASGAEKSASDYVRQTGNNKYLVKVSPNIPYDAIDFSNPPSLDVIRSIKAYEKKYYEDLRAAYKRLGLVYDASQEVKALLPSAWAEPSLPEEQRVVLNWTSPVIKAMREEKFKTYASTATNKVTDLQRVAQAYGGTGLYTIDKPTSLPSIPGLRLITNGKEDFGASEPKTGNSTITGFYTNAIYNGTYSFIDESLVTRYLLSNDGSAPKGIPVIVSVQEAVSLFGASHSLGDEPERAEEKATWIKKAQESLNGTIYQACYRNSAEQSLLTKIQRDYEEMKTNEGVEGYVKPSLLYAYPKDICGDITVAKDTRTAEEKQASRQQDNAQQKLGTYVAPTHQLITFEIVGLKYSRPYTDTAQSADEYLKSLLTPLESSSSAEIPLQRYEALPATMKLPELEKSTTDSVYISGATSDEFSTRVVEFTSAQSAQKFLSAETCPTFELSCDKSFRASPYGSNYLVIDEIGRLFGQVASVVFPATLLLAVVIIGFTFSRIMAENRKETAVYRAMGAKRHDIAAIYSLYTLLVAARIAALSLIIGIGIALAVDATYGQNLTNTAAAAFGIIDEAPAFRLFDLSSPLLLVVIASIFATSVIASVQPLIRNVSRSPIRDIRDE